MSDSLKVKGFAEIELVSKDGRKRVIKPNTITKVGKMYMLERSANEMLMGFTGVPYGRLGSLDVLNKMYYTGSTGVVGIMYPRQDLGLNMYLLNLQDDISLSEDTKFLNIFNNGLEVDNNMLVGYANSRDYYGVERQVGEKEGVIDFTKPEYMVDNLVVANRWKFDTGIGTGTFNTIVIAPGLHSGYVNGITMFRNITRINDFEDYDSYSSQFIIPGVPNITGPNEVLLFYTRRSKSRWKYNLSTGETTVVDDPSDPAYNINIDYMGNIKDMMYLDGYLYIVNVSGSYLNIDKINVNDVTDYTTKRIGGGRLSYASMFYDGQDIVVIGSNIINSSDYIVSIVNPDTLSITSGDYTTLGLGGLPSNWTDKYNILVKQAGNYYIVNRGIENIKCTSLSDVTGTMVNIFLAAPNTIYVDNGTDIWMFSYGLHYPNLYNPFLGINDNYNFSNTYLNSRRSVYNEDDAVESSYYPALFASKEWYSNIISFIKLDTPITKNDNDILYVSYGYKMI